MDSSSGAPLPPTDSLDMWDLLSGRNLTSPRTEIAFTPLRGLQPLPPPTRNHVSRAGLGDLLDPMLIQGEYKLLMGKVDQCWWQGPQYPNGSSTWDTYATWINCTTPTKKACLFNGQTQRARSPACNTLQLNGNEQCFGMADDTDFSLSLSLSLSLLQ